MTAVFLGCVALLSVLLQTPNRSIVYAAEGEPQELYARSAVLMDADTGRILFSKAGDEKRAMASTTKIMTCILALENGDLESVVTASKNAVKQPKVHLGAAEGETFYLKDLLFSLMLESHNDSAVMIAEHIAGSVEAFARLMNEKAKELSCTHTYFITPNGLDAKDDRDFHHTTAEELATIMRYCVNSSPQKEEFINITGTKEYRFSNCEGKKQYYCRNHNAFLEMMDGAFSGKTGFTGEAGYCYVGALEKNGKKLIVALLGCGWPNHKGYKWEDSKKLMSYGLDYFEKRKVWKDQKIKNLYVEDGIDKNHPFQKDTEVEVEVENPDPTWTMLLHKEEQLEVKLRKKNKIQAPVKKGEKIGTLLYQLDGQVVRSFDVVSKKAVRKVSYPYYFKVLAKTYFTRIYEFVP